jgi:hypothetical protein
MKYKHVSDSTTAAAEVEPYLCTHALKMVVLIPSFLCVTHSELFPKASSLELNHILSCQL